MKNLEFEYIVEEKDYINFKFTEIFPEKFRAIGNVFFFIVILSMCFNTILWKYGTGEEIQISDFLILIIMAVFFVFYYYTVKQSFRKMREFQNPIKCQMTTHDITFEGAGFVSKLNWSTIKKVRKKENYFLFFSADRIAFIMSKSRISTEQFIEIDKFLNQIANLDYK
ncbi:MAG TPA: YcxB family protein [Saprospiraceae bacterium]|nr:YcxB family protein [Saprospiraceae bacterium]